MPFPERRELLIPSNPARVATFISHLDRAVAEAGDFIDRGRFFTEDVDQWQRAMLEQETDRHGDDSAARSAVLGVAYSVAAEVITKRRTGGIPGFELGANGQQHMTIALLELHPDDRAIFVQPNRADIKRRIIGALSVARLATGFLERGTPCFMPSVDEDRRRAIDLLCTIQERGACIQIKTGAPLVNRIVLATNDDEKRLTNGTAHFNGQHQIRMIPFVVCVPGLRHGAHADLVDDKVRHLSNKVCNIVASSTP